MILYLNDFNHVKQYRQSLTKYIYDELVKNLSIK